MRTGLGVEVFRFREIPVYLKSSWFALMFLVIVGYGMYLQSRLSIAGAGAFVISTVVAVLIATGVLVHELAHAVVGMACGQRVHYISLTLWGGATKLSAGSALSSFVVSIAGPLVNALYALVLWEVGQSLDSSPLSVGIWQAAMANLLISICNLIPGYPLDGAHALEGLLTYFSGRRSVGVQITAWVSLLLIPAAIGWTVFRGWWQDPLSVAVVMLMCWYVWAASFPMLQATSSKSTTSNSLSVPSLLAPASVVSVSTSVHEVLASLREKSYVVFEEGGVPISWAEADHLRALERSAQGRTAAAQVALPLASTTLPLNARRLDVLEFFNGSIYEQQQEFFKDGELPLAYPVLEGRAILGLVFHQKIAEALYQESRYLRE